MKKLLFFISFVFLLFSCFDKKLVLPAKKDLYVTSLYPEVNFNGKNEALPFYGYGTKKAVGNKGNITYPALYLSNSDNDRSSFLVGGFDLSSFKKEVKSAHLSLFINYASQDRKRVTLFIRPILYDWDEKRITFKDVYKSIGEADYVLSDFIEKDDRFCKEIIITTQKNDFVDLTLPFKKGGKRLLIEITDIINRYISQKKNFYGFLVETIAMNNPDYITTTYFNKLADIGVIEFISEEFFSWDGKIPTSFSSSKFEWLKIKNRAKGKVKYIPHIIITE